MKARNKNKKNKIQQFDDPTMLRISTVGFDIWGNNIFQGIGNVKHGVLHNFFVIGLN